MSYAISKGLYHPRCKDSHTTYFPGVSTAEDTWTRKELEEVGLQSKEEARQQYAERQAEKYERLAKYSLDGENQRKYAARKEEWKIQANKYLGKSEKDIKQIKDYLIESDFDQDCAIAQSWQRIMSGKDVKTHDKTLIEHELLEMKIKRENPGIEHWKAHEITTKNYNYQWEAKKLW